MVRNDILRKRYAKRRIDGIIHDNLASVSKSLGPQQALERLLVYIPNRTDLLSPMPLGGEPSWTRAATSSRAGRPGPQSGPLATGCGYLGAEREFTASAIRQSGPTSAGKPSVRTSLDLVWFIDPSKEAHRKQKWFRHIGRGGGINGTDIPVRLTKLMVQHFMHAPDHARSRKHSAGSSPCFGGEPALVRAVNFTRLARDFDHEAYWAKVIESSSTKPIWSSDTSAPSSNTSVSRSTSTSWGRPCRETQGGHPAAGTVAKWQPPTRATNSPPSIRWDSIGIKGLEYDETQRWSHRTWTIRELLDSNELIVEGRVMRHCVARYVGRCAKQRTSIWSMTCYSCVGQEHVLTIEVDPGTGLSCRRRASGTRTRRRKSGRSC